MLFRKYAQTDLIFVLSGLNFDSLTSKLLHRSLV